MSGFWKRNIGSRGRLARGVIGGLSLIAGIILADYKLWLCLVLVGFGLLGIVEAMSGWCIVRACGIRTKF